MYVTLESSTPLAFICSYNCYFIFTYIFFTFNPYFSSYFFFHCHRKTTHQKESGETVILDHLVAFTHFMVSFYIAFTSWELFSLTKVISYGAETFESISFQSFITIKFLYLFLFQRTLREFYYLAKHHLESHPMRLDTWFGENELTNHDSQKRLVTMTQPCVDSTDLNTLKSTLLTWPDT